MSVKTISVKVALGGVLAAIGLFGGLSEIIALLFIFAGYLIIGGDVLFSAFQNILSGNVFDENFLMSIATVGAFIIGESAEAVVVMLFYQIGEAFQTHAVGKSRESISELMQIRPEFANVLRGDTFERVEPEQVEVGEIIVVKPGEKIPLDGIIMEGTGAIDTKALTGESLPLDVNAGDEVLSGCISINGLVTIKVTKHYTDSTVAKILDLVENATSKKSKSEKFITSFARYYTPGVVIAAVLLAVVPPILGMAELADTTYRALQFLVISCPCALVISIPLGFFGGIGGAAKKGILVKGSNYLEALSKADVVIFDKTGTLTKGTFEVKSVMPVGISEDELLEIAAIAESTSTHPIAKSITQAYGKAVDLEHVERAEEIAGHGLSVVYGGEKIYAGNHRLMDKFGIKAAQVETTGSIVHIAKGEKYLGYIIVADEIKEDSAAAIAELKRIGIEKTIMLTGDKDITAQAVGKELGLDYVYSELLPTDKVEAAEKELEAVKEKRKLVYVGDGINDAPVLARADVGIAMGGMGSQAAIEAADIVIMQDAPSKVVTAIEISKKTMQIVKQNIAFAFIVKGVVLLLATGGLSSLWEAIFADVGVAVLAILNAMRAMNFKERSF